MDMPYVLQWAVVASAALASIIVSAGVIARSKVIGHPIRWLVRQLIAEPVSEAFYQAVNQAVAPQIEEIHHQLTFNGGAEDTMRDRVNLVTSSLRELRAEFEAHCGDANGERWLIRDELGAFRDEAGVDRAAIRAEIADLDDKITKMRTEVDVLVEHDRDRDVAGKRYQSRQGDGEVPS